MGGASQSVGRAATITTGCRHGRRLAGEVRLPHAVYCSGGIGRTCRSSRRCGAGPRPARRGAFMTRQHARRPGCCAQPAAPPVRSLRSRMRGAPPPLPVGRASLRRAGARDGRHQVPQRNSRNVREHPWPPEGEVVMVRDVGASIGKETPTHRAEWDDVCPASSGARSKCCG